MLERTPFNKTYEYDRCQNLITLANALIDKGLCVLWSRNAHKTFLVIVDRQTAKNIYIQFQPLPYQYDVSSARKPDKHQGNATPYASLPIDTDFSDPANVDLIVQMMKPLGYITADRFIAENLTYLIEHKK